MELRVGGQTYRVVATDDDQHVQHLAALVDRKYLEVVPPRGVTPQQAIFLTAMALAEEAREQRERAERLELERDRSTRVAHRAREAVVRLLQKVESVLGGTAAPDAARATSLPAEDSRDVRQSLPPTTGHPDLRQAGPRSGARASTPPANQTSPDAAPPDSIDLYELLNPSHDVRQPHEQPAPAVRTPLPGDLRQPLPADVRQSLPQSLPADVRSGGLRLLRQSASWSPGAPSKSGPDDDSR